MLPELALLSLTLGTYHWLDNYNPLGLALLGMGSNLLILSVASPGHLLTQSMVLTAVVIGAATLAVWVLNWGQK